MSRPIDLLPGDVEGAAAKAPALIPLVINLRRNPRRMAHMETALGRIGVDFTRLEAVDFTSLPPAALGELIATYGTRGHPHPLLKGQVGNLLSHSEAWKRIGEGESNWGVVLEDDLHVVPALSALLKTTAWIPASANIVRLETTRQGVWLRRRLRARAEDVGIELAEIAGPSWGAAAYMIERQTARWLSALPPNLAAPSDKLMFAKGTPVADALCVWQVIPAPCVQDKYHPVESDRLGFDSDIEMRKHAASAKIEQATAIIKNLGRRLTGKSLVPFAT